jgi:GNAT superfamily N-acetyltransferase
MRLKYSISPTKDEADIPELAHIHVAALENDDSAKVKFSSAEEFRMEIEGMLRGQMRDEKGETEYSEQAGSGKGTEDGEGGAEEAWKLNEWFIVKATIQPPLAPGSDKEKQEGDEGMIVGWASWLHERIDVPSGNSNAKLGEGQMASADQGSESGKNLLKPSSGLAILMRERQRRAYSSWALGYEDSKDQILGLAGAGEFISLRALFVLPEFQGHGIASALVRYGHERGERTGLPMLVTSTTAAKRVYEGAGGFAAFDHVEVDLREWGLKWAEVGGQGAELDRKYRMYFMARK